MQISCRWQALMPCRERKRKKEEEDKGKKEKYLQKIRGYK